MKSGIILAAAVLLALAAPAYADDMPYFGSTPHDGNWWNGPKQDYRPSGGGLDARGEPFGHSIELSSRASRLHRWPR